MTLIVDAGPLVAAAISTDRHNRACKALLARGVGPLLVPQLVVAEVAYLLADRLGPAAETAFVAAIAAGELEVEPVAADEWARVHELVKRYEDLPLGVTDASVVVLAERLGHTTVASLDHRHLAVVQPAHVERLSLVPQLGDT
ncbi:MAG TPA: PIN domain-containing protein [Euzebya sp.]|nr:PIN domain-containing protein [Euzebya sp.]